MIISSPKFLVRRLMTPRKAMTNTVASSKTSHPFAWAAASFVDHKILSSNLGSSTLKYLTVPYSILIGFEFFSVIPLGFFLQLFIIHHWFIFKNILFGQEFFPNFWLSMLSNQHLLAILVLSSHFISAFSSTCPALISTCPDSSFALSSLASRFIKALHLFLHYCSLSSALALRLWVYFCIKNFSNFVKSLKSSYPCPSSQILPLTQTVVIYTERNITYSIHSQIQSFDLLYKVKNTNSTLIVVHEV